MKRFIWIVWAKFRRHVVKRLYRLLCGAAKGLDRWQGGVTDYFLGRNWDMKK